MATETRTGTLSPQPQPQPQPQPPGALAASPRPAAAPVRRPWSLWAAATLLALLGTLLALTWLSGDDASIAMLVIGLAVAAAGVLPLVLRTVGWWVAVVATVLLVLFVVLGLAADANAALVVGLCWVLVAGGMLALAGPGSGRSAAAPVTEPTRPGVDATASEPPAGSAGTYDATDPAGAYGSTAAAGTYGSTGSTASTASTVTTGDALPHPDGWTREWAGGWVKLVALSVFGALCLLVGLAMTGASLSGRPGDPGTGMSLLVLAFGITIVATLPIFWPRRTGRPGLRDLADGRGVAFDYSPKRRFAAVLGSCAFTVCGLALLLSGETDVMRVVGALGALLFGFFAWYVLRRRTGRWAVVATPTGIGTVDGPGAVVVPWDEVRDVVADETTTYVRGFANHEPHIAVHTESGAVRHDDAVDEALAGLNRGFTGADLVIPVRALGVDPVRVLCALRHYLHHPDQRAELGDRRALDRIARGDLDRG